VTLGRVALLTREPRRTGGRHALGTMRLGGGQSIAAVFERI